MKAKEYLGQIAKIDTYIKNKLIERKQWQDIATGITAEIGRERVQSSGDKQRMATAIAKYLDIEQEINDRLRSLTEQRKEIIGVIEQLDSEVYDFLHMVYVQHIPLKKVAELKHYSYSWATTFHGRALQKVQRILDNKNVEL